MHRKILILKTIPGSGIQNQETARPILIGLLIIFSAMAIVGLFLLAMAAHSAAYFNYDLTWARDVQNIHDGGFSLLMRGVGDPGYPPQVYVWLVLVLFILYKSGLKWAAIAEVFASVGIGVVGLIVKILVNRPRPSATLIYVANPALDGGKYSFPAGHVEVYMAILGFLLFLSITLAHRYAWMRTVEIIGYTIFLALIGISRVYVGEHWPSDVFGAYLLGGLWLELTILFYEWGKSRFFVDQKIKRKKGAVAS